MSSVWYSVKTGLKELELEALLGLEELFRPLEGAWWPFWFWFRFWVCFSLPSTVVRIMGRKTLALVVLCPGELSTGMVCSGCSVWPLKRNELPVGTWPSERLRRPLLLAGPWARFLASWASRRHWLRRGGLHQQNAAVRPFFGRHLVRRGRLAAFFASVWT